VIDFNWEVLATATPAQAHLLRNLLQDHGIDAQLDDTVRGGLIDMSVSGYMETTLQVLVPADQLEAAEEVLAQVQDSLAEGVSLPELAQLEVAHGQDASWPACPHCARPRLARCPICETSGTHFDTAFLPENFEESPDSKLPTFICPTCDEPIRPDFLARCEWCGHRFGDGVALPQRASAPAPLLLAEVGLRAFIVMVGLLATLAAIFGWFYFVLR
jgi:hypothetical protein